MASSSARNDRRPLGGNGGSSAAAAAADAATAAAMVCLHPGCSRKPTYGVIEPDGTRNVQYCAPHSSGRIGMVNVAKRKWCAVSGCRKHPSFCMKGDKALSYCHDHASDGMVRPVKSEEYEPTPTRMLPPPARPILPRTTLRLERL